MLKILLCIMMNFTALPEVGAIDEVIEAEIMDMMIESAIEEAVEVFNVSRKDIDSFISIESSGRVKLMGSSGEFGIMQIMPYEFTNYGPKVNEILKEQGRPLIEWKTTNDKYYPRTNIMIGAYSFRKRLNRHNKDPIWASMSYNVGDRGVKITKEAWANGHNLWYCAHIKNSIRRGRQFTYSHKFARKSGRLKEWRKKFGDIPRHVMNEFWEKNGDTYCVQLQDSDI